MLIGRTKELDLILQEIRKPATASDLKRIIAVHGMFGVGKSTLLREVITELQQGQLVDAILYSNEDAHIEHLPEFMYQLVNSFRACKDNVPRYKSDETDSRWMRFNEINQELEAATRTELEHTVSGRGIDTRSQFLKQRSADERRLMTDTASVMCETLIVDLMNTFYPLNASGSQAQIPAAQSQTKIIVVIDTYEKMTTALNSWLLEHFLLYCYIKRFGDFRSYNSPYLSPEVYVRQFFDIRFVIAGREPLRSTDPERRWDRWQHTFLELGLKQFDPQNIREYFEENKLELKSVDEVLHATAGIPYLVSLWSQANRLNEAYSGGDQTIAAHAQERIFWYKTPQQVEWIRSAAFCDWFDADVLRCFRASHEQSQEAYNYLRRASELCRESSTHPEKLELLPVVRESIRHAVRQESPDLAREYEQVVKTYTAVTDFLSKFDQDEQDALRHLAFLRRCDMNTTLRDLWPAHQVVVERLHERSPGLFDNHQCTISLQSDTKQLLSRFNSLHDRDESVDTQKMVQEYWAKTQVELEQEGVKARLNCEKIEKDILRLHQECDKAELDLADAKNQGLELEEQIRPLRQNTPPLTTNRDAAAARIAFVLCATLGLATAFAYEWMPYLQATPDMEEAIQKVLLAFTIGFTALFVFFVSRSMALRQRRLQHQRNRTILAELDERYATAREKLNGSFTLLDAKKKEAAILKLRKDDLIKRIELLDQRLEEAIV